MSSGKPRAKRMAPEARREALMDAAAALMVRSGHSGCTLEQVAAEAGVSTPLIYKYFPRREDLLRAMLKREFSKLGGRGLDGIPGDVPLEKVIRSTVQQALRYYHDHGPILRLLSADPAVASLTQQGNRNSRSSTSEYFIRQFVSHYGVPREVATIAVTLVINAPIHSMRHLRQQNIDIEQTIEVWTEFIVGGWRALQARYGEPPPD